MRRTFLCSTVVDMEAARESARQLLGLIEQSGGVEASCFEDFLTKPGAEPQAVVQCLIEARNAAEAILILRRSAGSPCLVTDGRFQPAIKRVQGYVSKEGMTLLPFDRRLPPVAWVEADLIGRGRRGRSRRQTLQALIDPRLVEVSQEYFSRVKKANARKKVEELFKAHPEIRRWNDMGADGRTGPNVFMPRMIWLCEFVGWVLKENIPKRDLSSVDDVRGFFAAHFPAYYQTIASGTLWLAHDSQLADAIGRFQAEVDGEVWSWNNDLAFLTNAERFARLYKPHATAFSKILLVVQESRWLTLERQPDKLAAIRSNLSQLPKKVRDRIQLGLWREAEPHDSIAVTLLGMEGESMRRVMLMRPVTWSTDLGHHEVFANLVVDREGANSQLIDTHSHRLKEAMKQLSFESLLSRVSA